MGEGDGEGHGQVHALLTARRRGDAGTGMLPAQPGQPGSDTGTGTDMFTRRLTAGILFTPFESVRRLSTTGPDRTGQQGESTQALNLVV